MVKKISKKQKSTELDKKKEDKSSEINLQQEDIPKKTKKNKRQLQSEEGIENKTTSTGAIYVGHLPWGFIDETIKKYFNQFGHITRIICPKSSKTGRSVGYAFIEFEDEETARIAAKTMNNYILFEKILKCSYIEDKSKYDRIFLKWKKKFELKNRYQKNLEKMNKKESNEDIKIRLQDLLDREEQKREKFKELGIDYEYKGFKEIVDEYKQKHKKEISEKNKNKKEGKNNKKDDNKNNNIKDNLKIKNQNKKEKIKKKEKMEEKE